MRRPLALYKRPNEEGSALVLALVFAFIFSILVTAVITFTDVGLKSSKAYRERRIAAIGPDSAIQAAIQQFREPGTACTDFAAPKGPNDELLGGRELVVRCQRLGSSSPGGPAGESTTTPASALLSLGDDESEGIKHASNLRVRGDVFSNSTITSSGGTMVVEGEVSQLSACTPLGVFPPSIQTDPNTAETQHCGAAANADPVDGLDPDYTKATTTVPMRREAPACPTGTDWLVTLEPGYYDNAAALSLLTVGACPMSLADGLVVWMKPGNYYFDFSFDPAATSKVWTINHPRVNIVGGEPKGWDPVGLTRPTSTELGAPGGCKTNGDPTFSAGVQVIVGGESRLEVLDGQMELCGREEAEDQQIALYGIGNDPANGVHVLRPTAFGTISDTPFTTASRSLVIGELPPGTADAALSPSGPVSSSIAVKSFRQLVPPGSVIDSAVLRVSHNEPDTNVIARVTPAFVGATCLSSISLPSHTAPATDEIDLRTACGLDGADDLANLEITYKVELNLPAPAATAQLDGIAVDVSYRIPVTRRPTTPVLPTAFTNPQNALEIGEGLTADAVVPAAGSVSLALSGYADPPIPAGASIASAKLRVADDASGVTGPVTVDVTSPTASCTKPSAASIDLTTDCGFDAAGDFEGLTVTYNAASTPAGIAKLDGIWLELVYVPSRNAGSAISTTFDDPNNAIAIGSPVATANLGAPDPPSASVTLSGYDASPIPDAARIDSAVLRVAHREEPGAAAPTFSVSNTAGPLGACPTALSRFPGTLIREDRIDLKACGLGDPTDLAGFAVTYEVDLEAPATNGIAHLDGIVLEIDYRAPSSRSPMAAPTLVSVFDPPDKARVINGDPANAPLDKVLGPPAAAITLGGFHEPLLPPGSVVESATLRVAHQEEGAVDKVSVTPSFTDSTCAAPINLTPLAALGESPGIDLMSACGFQRPDQLDDLFTVKYDASIDAPTGVGIARLDGLALDIVFRVPKFEPLAGSVSTVNGDAVVRSVATNPASRFVVNGTVYTPKAAVDLAMGDGTEANGIKAQVLTRGVIARAIRLDIRTAPSYNRPIGGVPPEAVLFTAYSEGRHRPASPTLSAPFTGEADDATDIVPADESPTASDMVSATLTPLASSASIALDDFTHDPALAAGAVIDSAVLRVGHREDAGVTEVKITLSGAGLSPEPRCTDPMILAGSTTPVVDAIDLASCGIDSAADLADLQVTYEVTGATGTADLDGIVLDVYSGPLLRARVSFDSGGPDVEGWSVLT